MSEQKCVNCGQLLEGGDAVRALIDTRFVGLKSKIHYALEKPTNCLEVYHQSCQYPKGNPDNVEESDID